MSALNLLKGNLSLSKGDSVLIEKTTRITATCTWNSATDYDLYAVVLLKNGRQEVCSTFGSENQRIPTDSIVRGAVVHGGDVGRSGGVGCEILRITLTDEIDSVAVVAYSAQSNGSGSFRKYRVGLSIDNHAGTVVGVDAKNANKDNGIYTVCVGIIRNRPEGVVIDAVEQYSKRGSESRPQFVGDQIVMDDGSRNLYK